MASFAEKNLEYLFPSMRTGSDVAQINLMAPDVSNCKCYAGTDDVIPDKPPAPLYTIAVASKTPPARKTN